MIANLEKFAFWRFVPRNGVRYRTVEKYLVRLTAEERAELEAMTRQRQIAADKQLRAKLLLHADAGKLGPVHYPHAEKIVLVQDNLNTPKPASLYQAFPPDEARRLIQKLEIHYTPKHGSWLNRAETELGILSRQGLDRRISDPELLASEVQAREPTRNAAPSKVIWQFTTAEARVKLHRFYPQIAGVNSG